MNFTVVYLAIFVGLYLFEQPGDWWWLGAALWAVALGEAWAQERAKERAQENPDRRLETLWAEREAARLDAEMEAAEAELEGRSFFTRKEDRT